MNSQMGAAGDQCVWGGDWVTVLGRELGRNGQSFIKD